MVTGLKRNFKEFVQWLRQVFSGQESNYESKKLYLRVKYFKRERDWMRTQYKLKLIKTYTNFIDS